MMNHDGNPDAWTSLFGIRSDSFSRALCGEMKGCGDG